MAVRTRREGRLARHRRVRQRVSGTAERPRLAVFRSLTHIYAQLVDDRAGRTLVSASSVQARASQGVPGAPPGDRGAGASGDLRRLKKTEIAAAVGKRLGERAAATGIREAVFDRGGYRYHGRVKALAEAARAAGLRF